MQHCSNNQHHTPSTPKTDSVEPTLVGVTKRQVRSLSPKRKTSKKRRSGAPPITPLSIDSDDSSQDTKKSASSRRRGNSKSKKIKRRCASPRRTSESSKLQAMQEEITKLKSIQDKMEKYQANLEKEHRDFQRQLHAMELSHAMAETRNCELDSELEEAVEENERLRCCDRRRSTQDENDSRKALLRFENQILRGKLERCQLALLRSTKRQPRQ